MLDNITEAVRKTKCDCVTNCGDDPRVERGEVEPCNMRKNMAVSIMLDELGKIVIEAARLWSNKPSLSTLRNLDEAVKRYENFLEKQLIGRNDGEY